MKYFFFFISQSNEITTFLDDHLLTDHPSWLIRGYHFQLGCVSLLDVNSLKILTPSVLICLIRTPVGCSVVCKEWFLLNIFLPLNI